MFYFRVSDCCADLLCVSYCCSLYHFNHLVAFEINIYLSIYVSQVMKTEFVPKATTVVACGCVIFVAVSLSDRVLTMRTLASTGYLDALVTFHDYTQFADRP